MNKSMNNRIQNTCKMISGNLHITLTFKIAQTSESTVTTQKHKCLTHNILAGVLSAISPKGIAPSSDFDNGQLHNLIHIQRCKTSHHFHNVLLYHHS